MCFSPTASFGASAVLSLTGIVSFSRSQNVAQRTLAGIPFIFAVQQFTEGVVWMSLLHPAWARWESLATYAFQVFAEMVWPIYIPLCMLLFERVGLRKKAIAVLLGAGVLLSAYTGYCLCRYPVHAFAESHHIRYELGFPLAKEWYYGVLYFIPTIVSSLISSLKRLRWLGYLFFLSYIVARLLFHYFEVSVWCFFGATISLVVLLIIERKNKVSVIKAGVL